MNVPTVSPAVTGLRAPSFSTGRVRLAVLLQCAPILSAAVLPLVHLTGGVAFVSLAYPRDGVFLSPTYPLDGVEGWLPQILSLPMLLSGSGYVVVKRWRRFICSWLLGVCGYTTFQGAFASPGSRAWGVTAIVVVALAGAMSALDVWRLSHVSQPLTGMRCAGKVIVSILICASLILYIVFSLLVLYLTIECRAGCALP